MTLRRLLNYARPYTLHLLLSVILMAVVGAAQALMALLIKPIFDRVLEPQSVDAPVVLFTIPILKRDILLDSFMPRDIHHIFTMVAIGILGVFFIRGVFDYCANYLVNYAGFGAVTDLRQEVFEHVVHQDAHFFEANSTARVMSSIMNDLEKIQVALSQILADLLRQSFTAIFLTIVVWQTDWRLALFSFTVVPWS
jgi:subfamily B ATP-binding cassette protein MsbA